MSKTSDVQANETLLHQVVDEQNPQIAALIGFHALTELAHTMAQEKFAEFIQSSLQDAQQTHQDFTSAQNQTNPLQSS